MKVWNQGRRENKKLNPKRSFRREEGSSVARTKDEVATPNPGDAANSAGYIKEVSLMQTLGNATKFTETLREDAL